MKNYFEILKSNPLFKDIADENIDKLLICLAAQTKKYEKNSIILSEGKTTTKIGIVLTGEVRIEKEDYYGNRTIVANVTASQLFAEAFACVKKKMPVSVIAATDCYIMFIESSRIANICENQCDFHSSLVNNLLNIMAEKNIILNRKIELLSQRTTKEKLLSYLTSVSKEKGCNEFDIAFNRQQLADFLGVDRSAMSFELSKLKSEGKIDYNKFHFIIHYN